MTSDRPHMLVAAPSLQCPFFERTVVLLVDHDAEGSFGFVLNKASPLSAERIFEELELPTSPTIELPVLLGGPVSPETGWVIFDPKTADDAPGDTMFISDHLAVTASLTMLETIAAGRGPAKATLALGYAGWSPGQLEDEMSSGSWIPVDADPVLVFDTEYDLRWESSLRTLGIDPMRFVSSSVAQA